MERNLMPHLNSLHTITIPNWYVWLIKFLINNLKQIPPKYKLITKFVLLDILIDFQSNILSGNDYN